MAVASASWSRASALLLCLLTAGPTKPRCHRPAPHLPGSEDERPLRSHVSLQPSGWPVLGDRAAPRGLGEPLGFPVALVAVCVSGRAGVMAASRQAQSVFRKRPAAAHVSTRQPPRSARFRRGKSRAELGAIGLHELPLLWHPATEDNTSLEVGQNWVTNHRSHVCHPVLPSQKKGRGYIFQEVYPAAEAFGKQRGQSCAALTLCCRVPALPVPEQVPSWPCSGGCMGQGQHRRWQSGNPKASMPFQVVGQHWSMIPKEAQGILFLSVSLVPGWEMSSWDDLIQLVLGSADSILSSSTAPFLGWRVPAVAAEVLRLARRQAPSWETSLAQHPCGPGLG